uniref:Uncharacterized protein n=1 Tax=Acanthochromis polyacanthus TaxID=80966 RepID=A0A3Q1GAZ0_9TELE
MSSMLSPASRRFSMSTSRLTPSTTICTSSTSEKPRRSALEMSKTPPTAAVSTPPERQTGGNDVNTTCTTDHMSVSPPFSVSLPAY